METSGHQRQTLARLKILIADDVQATRRTTRIMLSTIAGVEVVAIARNGHQAVALTQKHHPDIALMDVNMPEMDGLTAIRKMLVPHPGLVCIVISAERSAPVFQEAINLGVNNYLTKPFTIDELERAIQKAGQTVLQNRQRMDKEARLRRERTMFAKRLATEYVKTRRSDDKAVQVFEYLATDPHCEMRWLLHLAMLYVLRQKWGRLKQLAARLEQRSKK